MKSFIAALSLLTLAPFAAANFDLYQVDENDTWDTQNFGMWSIFEGATEPNCDEAWSMTSQMEAHLDGN